MEQRHVSSNYLPCLRGCDNFSFSIDNILYGSIRKTAGKSSQIKERHSLEDNILPSRIVLPSRDRRDTETTSECKRKNDPSHKELQCKISSVGEQLRVSLTKEQTTELEAIFKLNPYPDAITKYRLSKKTSLHENRIRVWFQNRRAKWRREKKTWGYGSVMATYGYYGAMVRHRTVSRQIPIDTIPCKTANMSCDRLTCKAANSPYDTCLVTHSVPLYYQGSSIFLPHCLK